MIKKYISITFFLILVAVSLRIRRPLPVYSQGLSFDYPDFSSAAGLNLVGTTARVDDRLRLTSSKSWQNGAIWYTTRQFVQEGFETTFQFQITNLGSNPNYAPGADGIVFVIQNHSASSLGAHGGGIGYGNLNSPEEGIPNSIAIEFDTWSNDSNCSGCNFNDPNNNHVSVQTRGLDTNTPDHNYSLGTVSNIPDLSDGTTHTVKIDYYPGSMRIFMDNLLTPILTVNVSLSDTLTLDNGYAWVGFTSATGLSWESHDLLNWSFDVQVRDFSLDLPIAYRVNGLSFNEAFRTCVTALFDHHYPFEKEVRGDQNLLPYTGVPISDTLEAEAGCQFGVNCYDGHEGYDFDDLSACGTVALAAADGEIISGESGCNKGYGCQVVITHTAGYSTLYGHLRDDITLKTSGTVNRGDVIGTIGETGQAIGSHLHFGVYHKDQVVDPSGYQQGVSDPWEVRSGAISAYLWVGEVQTREAVDGMGGGTITSPSGDVVVSIPPGAYTDTVNLDLVDVPVAAPSAQLRSTGHSFSLHATDRFGNPITTFNQPLTITTRFSLSDLIGIKSGTLALYTWDNATLDWQPRPTTVAIDGANGTATIQTNHLSYFALLGEKMYRIYLPLVFRRYQ